MHTFFIHVDLNFLERVDDFEIKIVTFLAVIFVYEL